MSKSQHRLAPLLAWRTAVLSRPLTTDDLSVEGLPYADIPSHMVKEVRAYRKLNQAGRLRLLEKWNATLPAPQGRPVSDLIRFYRDRAPAGRGQTLAGILSYTDLKMEQTHDWVQWCFPLPQPSQFQPQSPLLTSADIEVFKEDLLVQANVVVALERFAEFLRRTTYWQRPQDHNHLRITRVLRFLVLIDKAREAQAMLLWLLNNHPQLQPETRRHWVRALSAEMPDAV